MVILICISLISDVEYVFTYLLGICMVSLENHLVRSSFFSIRLLLFCYEVVGFPYIFWILNPYLIYGLQIFFLPFCGLPVYSVDFIFLPCGSFSTLMYTILSNFIFEIVL